MLPPWTRRQRVRSCANGSARRRASASSARANGPRRTRCEPRMRTWSDGVTLGVSDPPGQHVASFGSYHINGVVPNYTYLGTYSLSYDSTPPHGWTSAMLQAQ